jgi:hypothetical protein
MVDSVLKMNYYGRLGRPAAIARMRATLTIGLAFGALIVPLGIVAQIQS